MYYIYVTCVFLLALYANIHALPCPSILLISCILPISFHLGDQVLMRGRGWGGRGTPHSHLPASL